jgi:CubicO group peptidase (beta-lactamase class C family)
MGIPVVAVAVVLLVAAGRRVEEEPLPQWIVPALPDSVWMDRILRQAENSNPLSSLVVAHGDSILVERYYRGMSATTPANVKSASKSVLSALVGIALQKGFLDSLGEKVADRLPEYFDGDTDPAKRQITLRHLITMSAGLETTSFYNYDAWIVSSDWVRHALDQPMVAEPGSRYIYSTGNTHLLSVILTRATGMSTLEFGRRYLFEPLGIQARRWDRDPQGYYLGGNNMSFTARELLAIGQLYLHEGRYQGRQILPREWIEGSWQSYTGSRRNSRRYGYGWWNQRLGGEDVHFALGYGGQFIFVVPSLDLTVVATSSLTNRPRRRNHSGSIRNLVGYQIIPAVRDLIRNHIPRPLPTR